MTSRARSLTVSGAPVAFAVATAVLVSSCSDTDLAGPTDPAIEPNEPAYSEAQTEETVSWGADNALEVVDDDGVTWRYERNSATPTQVQLYRNNVPNTTINLTYQNGEVHEVRVTEATASNWADSDTDGTISDTNHGWSGGGGGGGGCEPNQPGCEPIEPEAVLFMGCSAEADAVMSAGNTALTTGGVAVLTAGTPVNTITAGAFAIATANYGGRILDWGMCMLQ